MTLNEAEERIQYLEAHGIQIMNRSIKRRELAVKCIWIIIGMAPFAIYGLFKLITE